MTAPRSKFISVDGIEGAGKSTHLPALADLLESSGRPCVLTREPGGTPLGERVRELLLSDTLAPASLEAELLLMFAARAEHVETVIRPALAQGSWVLTDRFLDASFAYQGAGWELGIERVATLADWLLPDLRPDLVIVLDVPVEEALERIQRRSRQDRYEKQDAAFFQRVRQYYLDRAAAMPECYRVIDAQRPVAEVRADVLAALQGLM